MSNPCIPLVYITRRLPQSFLQKLQAQNITFEMWDSDTTPTYADIYQKIAGRTGLICTLTEKIDEKLIKAAGPQLKVISTMSVGYNHIDIVAAKARGIRIGYTPGVLADATSELAMALLLATSRNIVKGAKKVPAGEWLPWSPFWMTGKGLARSTVGIVGLGDIGKRIGQRCAAFSPSKIVYSGSGRNTQNISLATIDQREFIAEYATLQDLLAQSDFVILSCIFTEATRNLMNDKTLKLMKPGSILINVARGEVVDQEALYEILKLNRPDEGIAAAGLDVTTPEPLPTDHPLLTLDNCLVIPHLGSAEINTRKTMVDLSIDNTIAAITGTSMPFELAI